MQAAGITGASVYGTGKKARRKIDDQGRSDMENLKAEVRRKKKIGLQQTVKEEPEQTQTDIPDPVMVASPIFYLSVVMIGIAELTLMRSIELGMLTHAMIIIALAASIASLHKREAKEEHSKEQFKNTANLLSAVMILPLIRIFDFALPLVFFRQVYWSMVISLPLLIAIAYLGRNLGMSLRDAGLIPGKFPLQLAIALTGIAFGFMEYSLIHPLPLISSLSLETILVPAIVFMAFTGFTEELLFRGIIQTLAVRVYGPLSGILYSSALFTVMHVGFNSAPHMLFILAVSLFFGAVFYRTKSLTGVVLAHGITNIVLFLIAPFVMI